MYILNSPPGIFQVFYIKCRPEINKHERVAYTGGPMKYTGINHLAMATRDMEQTVRFWRDLLGMRLVLSLGRPGYRQYFFEISERDLLAFFEWPEVAPLPEKDAGRRVSGPFAFDHVSFGVATEADLRDVKGRMEAAGIWVSEVMDNGFISSIFSFDPNGIAIELSCPAGAREIRKAPLLADASPPPSTLEGPQPRPGFWPEPSATSGEDGRIYPGELGRLFKEALKKEG
jgi:catechol 2,3-dioxygenase-like lactoylglutathione lyase family enzyme